MKRDMDVVRHILLEIEQQPYDRLPIYLRLEGCIPEVVSYHVMLLSEAGLIEATFFDEETGWRPIRLTWEGHEFLEAIKDETRWNSVKSIMAQAGGFVFEIGKSLLIDYLKRETGLSK